MRNDQLILVQEHVGNGHGFVQQSAGISAQVKHQAIELGGIQIFQCCGQFRIGGFVESGELDVADAGFHFKIEVHGMLGNFVASDCKVHRFRISHALHGDVNDSALRALEHIGDFRAAQPFRGLAVHGHNYIARPDAGAVSR